MLNHSQKKYPLQNEITLKSEESLKYNGPSKA